MQWYHFPALDTTKFLGLYFCSNHSGLTHIKQIKARTLRTINILKCISHPSSSCNRIISLKTLIQLILHYGSSIYGLAPKSCLKLLDPVQTTSLRIATGAFRTSPALSLCTKTGIYPLHFRRFKLTANLVTKISLNPENSCYVSLFEKYAHKPSKHLHLFLNHSLANNNFKFNCLSPPPITSHIPAWLMPTPNINLEFTE